jgi:hypothetical protein
MRIQSGSGSETLFEPSLPGLFERFNSTLVVGTRHHKISSQVPESFKKHLLTQNSCTSLSAVKIPKTVSTNHCLTTFNCAVCELRMLEKTI